MTIHNDAPRPAITMKIDVLDKGFVRLVDHMGTDLSIVRSARISHDADWRAGDDESGDQKLLNYLYSHHHNTPFESVVFTFEVKAPIFVFRQWHRHRTQSYNELSARYTELPNEYYVPMPEIIGKQAVRNKQSRDLNNAVQNADYLIQQIQDQNDSAFERYAQLLHSNVPRELARSVLPVGTYSRMFATVNLHNLLRFLGERLAPEAQYEIRQYAKAILILIEPYVPITLAAFEKELIFDLEPRRPHSW